VNRYWRLDRHPDGNDFAAAFSLVEGPLRSPADGEVLVRNEYLSLDAGTRLWMTSRTDGYQPPLPLGEPIKGLVLGEVVASKHAGFQPGDLVRGFGEWGDRSLMRPELSGLVALDRSIADPRQHLGVLGLNALTAYVGVVEIGAARPGETVLVSAAAGATGMLAVQIARNMGCRVIGIAGGEEKCRFLVRELKVAEAIDYKAGNVEQALAALAPIHVYFDNVGGPLLDAVLPNLAHNGRVAVCGLVATYASDEPTAGPRRFDQVLMRRLTIKGFFAPDWLHRGDEINQLLRPWLHDGRITLRFDMSEGLESVPDAYRKLFTGANIGKVLVDLRR
jgi:NADPH-dependent curcumin reductase CurA